MTKARILLTRRWPEAVETHLASRYTVTLNRDDAAMDEAALIAAAQEHDVICPTVSDQVGRAVIEAKGSKVTLIANYGVGFEHIDLEACRRAGIAVSNTPDVLTDATADLAMTLILMAARRAGEGERELRAGQWTGWRPTHMLGRDLKGRTLGLVGFGRIAQALAVRAAFGFGMQIAYHSRNQALEFREARVGARFHPELETLLAEADVVSLHVPGGAQTRHMIDAAALARMKPDALLINSARGSLVDEDALAAALATGTIAGAGLDVFAAEPQVPQALRDLQNVVLLPHLGSATSETRIAMGMRAAANIEAWIERRELPDRVA